MQVNVERLINIFLILMVICLYGIGKQVISLTLIIIYLLIFPLIKQIKSFNFNTHELLVLAFIGAIAAMLRIPFAMIPSVQPTTFIIIATAIVIGSQAGFIIGLLAAFISSLYLGFGIWTVFQMIAWGLAGFYAGFLADTFILNNVIGRTIYGFCIGILFGWFMNLSFIILMIDSIDLEVILPYFIASFPFDLNHAITNSLLLFFFSHVWIKFMTYLTKKHRLFK